jgi:aminopeptidase N
LDLVEKQFLQPAQMTDEQVGLALALDHSELRGKAIETFFQRWQSDSLVLNKWFAIQASSWHPDTFSTVQKLWQHPAFDKKNPNRNYSLLGRFGANLERFHAQPEETYSWYADRIVELDGLNNAVAARLAGELNVWTKLPAKQKELMCKVLDGMLAKKLSDITYEVVKNCRSAEA